MQSVQYFFYTRNSCCNYYFITVKWFIGTLPIVYGIIPQQTQNFKLVSLCPGIEYVFNKLDDFITGAKQALTERM